MDAYPLIYITDQNPPCVLCRHTIDGEPQQDRGRGVAHLWCVEAVEEEENKGRGLRKPLRFFVRETEETSR